MSGCSRSPISSSRTIFRQRFPRKQPGSLIFQSNDMQKFLAYARLSGSQGKGTNEVIMVDPLEAKRLAAKQMKVIKAKEKLKRQRQIEAINGAWAMIGLTAGLVVEGQTGKGILSQLMDYWATFLGYFSSNA